MESKSKSDNRHLVEFIRELAQQEGITFHEAVQLAVKTIREHHKALGQ